MTERPHLAANGCRSFLPWEKSAQQGRTTPVPPRIVCGCRLPLTPPSLGPTCCATSPSHVRNGRYVRRLCAIELAGSRDPLRMNDARALPLPSPPVVPEVVHRRAPSVRRPLRNDDVRDRP